MTVLIEISGPGETMAGEVYLIEKALKSAGYNVKIKDPHRCEDMDRITNCPLPEIEIEVNHLPWGG